jgi:hypothetical protein
VSSLSSYPGVAVGGSAASETGARLVWFKGTDEATTRCGSSCSFLTSYVRLAKTHAVSSCGNWDARLVESLYCSCMFDAPKSLLFYPVSSCLK